MNPVEIAQYIVSQIISKSPDQNPYFAISEMAKNQLLTWGRSLKLNIFHEIDLYLISWVFGLDFF